MCYIILITVASDQYGISIYLNFFISKLKDGGKKIESSHID